MYSVGTDILKIDRIKKHISNGGAADRFFERFYGEDERAELEKRHYAPQSAAAMFCAKEAFSKAIGTGVVGFSLNEVQLLHNEKGAPYLALSGRAADIARKLNMQFCVSISHTDELAIATVFGYEHK